MLDEAPSYKIFIGNSGWGAGQLESELGQGAWRTMPASADILFSTDDNLWEKIFRQLGRSLLESIMKVKDLPADPTMN